MKLFKKKNIECLIKNVSQNFLKTLENMKINSSISRITVKSFNNILNILKLVIIVCIVCKKQHSLQ